MKIGKHNTDDQVFVIAELSANHNNKLDLALKTIDAMADSGADAVKIQTFLPESITLDHDSEIFRTRPDSLWAGRKLFDLYKESALPYDWHVPIKEHVEKCGMEFFSSPFDRAGVDFLESLNVPAYKVASLEINHIPLISHIASKGKPIIFSTGVAEYEDIEGALKAAPGVEKALLKCTSAYPTKLLDLHLNHIEWFKNTFTNAVVGLSDHSMSPFVPAVAVAKGARIVEKHFILDRSMGGVDSAFSLEPREFQQMVQGVREAEQALGATTYKLPESSLKARKSMRSIFVVGDIAAGDLIKEHHIKVLRPGAGLHPREFQNVLHKKAKKKLEKGHPLSWDDLER